MFWTDVTSLPIESMNNRVVYCRAAKVAGGGSAVNGMTYDRGSARDYDDWGKYIGDSSWGWDGLLPYFKKLETFTPPNAEQVRQFGIEWDWNAHGTDGPIYSGFPPLIRNQQKIFLEASRKAGVPVPKDGGAGLAVGAFWVPNNIKPGEWIRSYSKNGFHDAVKTRSNYKLLPEHQVTKVLFEGNTAVGVEYAQSATSGRLTVKAKKEVILSAGGTHTPKILQLSGVGDSRLLNQHKIPVVVDLPGVGNNLQDHGASSVQFQVTYPAEPAAPANLTRTVSTGNFLSFYSFPMISPAKYKDQVATALARDDTSYYRSGAHSSVVAGYKAQKSIMLPGFLTNETGVHENTGSGGLVSPQRPLSRGYVEITSANPFDPVNLAWRTISHPFDLTVAIEGTRFVRKLMNPSNFPSGISPRELSPGASVTTDEQLTTWIKGSMTPSFYHTSCSAHMGPREFGGVVDAKLKVYGTKGLRVADCSIIPMIPATHITNTVFAIAEKAADLIKADA
ncbi:alcohol oxidase [Ascobolus immersus RN42]|uniref:Alcohol oxidase n=1 Tax=Ascobolus immersus RN42 TaxID=1160509 RepID=A0A3N4IHP5_ASCIM|nr:alcohol oxidase [Ascobolus immersus RN42]